MTPRAAKANAEEKALIVRPTEAIEKVDKLMTDRRQQLLDLFGGDERITDRMRSLTLHALAKPKLLAKLQKADLATVIEAIRDCAALGLMPIGAMAEGYFVPYWNRDKNLYDIQFQPGYQGIAKLVVRSGKVLAVDAKVAYEHDVFDYAEGSAPFVTHKRALTDAGNRIAAYAVAWLPGGLTRVVVLPMAEIEKVRRSSKAADDGPWVEWYDEMAAKTALRRLCKLLPKDTFVEDALRIENEAEERYGPPPAPKPVSGALGRIHSRLGIAPPEEEPAVTTEAETTPEPEAVAGEVVSDPNATFVCGDESPYDSKGTCILEPDHSGNHRSIDRESWS